MESYYATKFDLSDLYKPLFSYNILFFSSWVLSDEITKQIQTCQTKTDCGNAALAISPAMVIIALLISVLSRLATDQEQTN